MIKVAITEKEFRFESAKTGKQCIIRCGDHPQVFGHPRHLMVSIELARPILNGALKEAGGLNWFSLMPPIVEVRIERSVAGGLADVDYRVIKEFFTYAGARRVEIQR
jgi:hypothetical protein